MLTKIKRFLKTVRVSVGESEGLWALRPSVGNIRGIAYLQGIGKYLLKYEISIVFAQLSSTLKTLPSSKVYKTVQCVHE